MSTTIDVTQGDTLEFPITITDRLTGNAVAIGGGDSLYFTLKTAVTDPDPGLLQLTIGSGITLRTQSGGTTGMADLRIAPAVTGALPVGTVLLWDIQYDTGADVWTVASGTLIVGTQITQHA